MAVPDNCEQPFHMYYLIMKSLENRSDFINHLRERGVMAAFHYQPLHSSQAGTKHGRTLGELPHTQRAADCLVRLPLWAGMNRSETDQVVEAVTTFQPS
jgi:dTDP-4-amino-4,6-dideoxygalactose transaminase